MSEQERVLSVYELAQGLKRTVESTTAGIWVEGEAGRVQRPVSGHLYFTLKDDRHDAMIDCVMYKRDAMRWSRAVVEGQRIMLRGRASFYPPRGRLQWIAEVAKPAGQGAILEALLRLRQKLIDEGLTDPARKRALPEQPQVVGVVTSRTGAALHDIVTVAHRRGAVRIVIAPAVVQGEGAVASLLAALERMERFAPDVLIVGRGGGSAEDLMAFNDERVVRRVASMSMPVVSAVGHEIDIALTDLVADARAATPSQAAELVVADASSRKEQLKRLVGAMERAAHGQLMRLSIALERLQKRIDDPRLVLFEHQQRLDEQQETLRRLIESRLQQEHQSLQRWQRRLAARHPRAVLERSRGRLNPLQQRLEAAGRRGVERRGAVLAQMGRALSALSPLSVLGRGYALATDESGRTIVDATQLSVGENVTVRVQRGSFAAKVERLLSQVENTAQFDHE